jgi:predicted nucleic acid-binding protein
LRHTEVLDFDQQAAWLAGQINYGLERAGTTIGCEDPLIAAIAITRDLPLVTGNVRHFEYVRELGHSLVIETWP